MEYPWTFLEKFPGFNRPYYISDEIDIQHQASGIYPPGTGYRILVTLVAIVGMTKSTLLYGQQPTGDGCRVRIRGRDSHYVSQPAIGNCASVDNGLAYICSAFTNQVPARRIQNFYVDYSGIVSPQFRWRI